jgi:hypothetical protein
VIQHLEFESTAKTTDNPPQFGINDYRQCIELRGANNCLVYDCNFVPYLYCDGVRLYGCGFVTVDWNTIWAGHDGVELYHDPGNDSICHDCTVSYNNITVYKNTGCRNENTTNCIVANNEITGIPRVYSGWCCLEVQDRCANLDINHNNLHDYYGCSSGDYGVAGKNPSGSINVHNNVMWNITNWSTSNITLNTTDPNHYPQQPYQNIPYWESLGYGLG